MEEETIRETDALLGSPRNVNNANNASQEESTETSGGCGSSIICDPRRGVHRYFVLFFMCFLSFGSYFCYDNPAALPDKMKEDMKISTSQFMMFYSLYSWPNVILCFFGGFLLDSVFGICWGTIIFSSIVTGGQLFFALGALVNSYYLMNFGRFVFGLGGENLCVAQNSYAVNWFHGRALNMVFGLQLSFSRVGSTVNLNIMGKLYEHFSTHYHLAGHVCLGVTLFVGSLFCLWSLYCAFMMGFFHKRANRILQKDVPTGEAMGIKDLLKQLLNIKDFSIHLWILCIICVAYYVAIFPFISLGKIFFINKFELDPNDAAGVISVVYIISAVASPFFGFCIDRVGKNIFWVGAGTILTIGCHGALAFTFINPWAPMIVLGFSYSILASALWPMVALVVARNQIGTAYGIMQSVQNLGLALIAIAAGTIVDKFGYFILEVFFLVCLFVALIAVVLLYLVDATRGGKLNSSAWKRRLLAEIEENGGEKDA